VCVTAQGTGVGGGFYECWGSKRVSKILFGNMFWLSFRWLLVMYSV